MKKNETKPIIRMFSVSKRYGGKLALKNITLNIQSGEFVFVTGPSGAGKTTLLKLLYLGESGFEGVILLDGMNLGKVKRKKIPFVRRKIGVIFQDFKLIPTKTVFDNVALVLQVANQSKGFIKKRVISLLRIIGMDKKAAEYPAALSGGEQQKVAVARAVAASPKLILADEPTGSLDADSANTIFEMLKKFNMSGTTVIVATHDSRMITRSGGRRIILTNGELVADTAGMRRQP